MKRCSTSLIIREMQIKHTVRYHFTPIRMATIKKPKNSQSWSGYGEVGTLVYHWYGCKMVWLSRGVLKKLKVELSCDQFHS